MDFLGSQIIEVYRISKETKIKQKERLVSKRIDAHEQVMAFAQDMIAMRPVNAVSDDASPRGPWVLENTRTFVEFYVKFMEIHNASSTWL